jgi:hypothetical protein
LRRNTSMPCASAEWRSTQIPAPSRQIISHRL